STTPKGAGTSQSTPTATTAFARRAVGYTPQRKRRGRRRDNAPLDAVKRSHRRGGSREHGSQHIVCAAALHFELRRKHHPMSEHGSRTALDVVRSDVVTAVEHGRRSA